MLILKLLHIHTSIQVKHLQNYQIPSYFTTLSRYFLVKQAKYYNY